MFQQSQIQRRRPPKPRQLASLDLFVLQPATIANQLRRTADEILRIIDGQRKIAVTHDPDDGDAVSYTAQALHACLEPYPLPLLNFRSNDVLDVRFGGLDALFAGLRGLPAVPRPALVAVMSHDNFIEFFGNNSLTARPHWFPNYISPAEPQHITYCQGTRAVSVQTPKPSWD